MRFRLLRGDEEALYWRQANMAIQRRKRQVLNDQALGIPSTGQSNNKLQKGKQGGTAPSIPLPTPATSGSKPLARSPTGDTWQVVPQSTSVTAPVAAAAAAVSDAVDNAQVSAESSGPTGATTDFALTSDPVSTTSTAASSSQEASSAPSLAAITATASAPAAPTPGTTSKRRTRVRGDGSEEAGGLEEVTPKRRSTRARHAPVKYTE